MKRIFRMLFIVCVLMQLHAPYVATGQTISLDVSATVPKLTPKMKLELYMLTETGQLPWSVDPIEPPEMNFGTLTNELDDGTEQDHWFAKNYFCAVLYVSCYSQPYEITSSGTALSNGSGAYLRGGSFWRRPVHIPDDLWKKGDDTTKQGPLKPGSDLGAPERAKLLSSVYKSEGFPASNRIIRLYYSIPSYDESGNPPEGFDTWVRNMVSGTGAIAPGTYTGRVTITLTY